jgi:hypothetical protein
LLYAASCSIEIGLEVCAETEETRASANSKALKTDFIIYPP